MLFKSVPHWGKNYRSNTAITKMMRMESELYNKYNITINFFEAAAAAGQYSWAFKQT